MKVCLLGFAAASLMLSSAAMASSSTSQTWKFSGNQKSVGSIQGHGTNTSLHGTLNGISLDITAWSSSLYGGVAHCGNLHDDKCVQRSQLMSWQSGLGVINGDEGNSSPDHSVDNTHKDYDMILLSFSEEVNIHGIDTGWNYSIEGSHWRSNQAGASVMAYQGPGNIGTLPFARTETWQDVSQRGWTDIGSDFKGNGSNGHIPVTSGSVFSKYWLVGAAHAILRDAGHVADAIKISGVQFKTQTTSIVSANAPASLAFIIAIAIWIGVRRKS